MKRVYISGALTNASEKGFYEALGEVVEVAKYTAYIPHKHTDPDKNPDATPKEVYDTDKKVVEESCLVILCANNPSFGTGMEAEIASAAGIPILVLAREDVRVSRMILGAPSVREVVRYETEHEALEVVFKFLEEF